MSKVVSWLVLAVAAVLFPLAVLAAYDVTGSSPPEPFNTGSSGASIPATVDIYPETLNLKSLGRWATAYIELPQGYDVGDIDIVTVRLCPGQASACPEHASVPAQAHPSAVGDHDHDGIPDLKVQFDRWEVIELLAGQTGDVTLTVAGLVSPPGQPLAGIDAIRVIDHGCRDGARDALCEDEEAEEEALEATPTPEATAPPVGPTFEYQVQPGDTLFDIALRFGTSVEALVELNGLHSAQVVWVGQVLIVPGTAPAAPAVPPRPPTPAVATAEYTVRPGENLSDVASFFGTTVETIVALNGLVDPNLIVPGQRLLVPEAAEGTGAEPPPFATEYVVQPGETLTDVAARFGTTVEALAAANRLANPSAIRYGDRLLVP